MAYREGQLTKIQINGFKSIRECSIDLKPINVLIGSNGAGKSNFISAFTLLQNILHQNLAVYAAQSGISSMFYNGTKVTEEIGMEFFFDNNSYGYVLIPTDDNRSFSEKSISRIMDITTIMNQMFQEDIAKHCGVEEYLIR